MDNHCSLQIRRAKRSKATLLDLSCLGLPRWPKDIFGLSDVETIKLNDNTLTDVPSDLSQLESLVTLDISNNKIEEVPTLDFDKLQKLRSINLEGNPIAKSLPVATLRQLSQPNPVQAFRDLFSQLSGGSRRTAGLNDPIGKHMASDLDLGVGMAARPAPIGPTPVAPDAKHNGTNDTKSFADYMKELDQSDAEYSDDFHSDQEGSAARQAQPKAKAKTGVVPFKPARDSDSDDPKPARRTAAGRAGENRREQVGLADSGPRSGQSLSSYPEASLGNRRLGGGSGYGATGGKEQGGGGEAAEVARLQAQVKELKAQLQSSKLSNPEPRDVVPSRHSLASTLPSRLHAMEENDGVDKLKQQVQEEQRKVKRLERENLKLQDRMRESSMSQGSTSVPHVELSEIQEGEILSKSGGFSVIYRGTWHGTPVAIKKLFDPSNSPENLAELDNEVEKLGKLRHPHILSLLAVHRKPPAFSIVMEIVKGGSLFQLLHNEKSFNIAPGSPTPVSEWELVRINESIALALSFMHARSVVHRDVKSHNVLLSPHLEAKLCDFGLARMKSELMTGAMQYAGTPQYMAPELLRSQKYTEKVDVFAFGTLLWECMEKDIPFANIDVPEIRQMVVTGKMLPIPNLAPPSIKSAIKACWAVDFNARPAMSEVLETLRTYLR